MLDLIPEIVNTCNVCRELSKPGPCNACSVDLADKFNQQVECDLLLLHKRVIFHMLDRCTPWHAVVITEKEEDGAVVDVWQNK